jgi:DNA-binding MurR/RpiR family transcriptional regulator
MKKRDRASGRRAQKKGDGTSLEMAIAAHYAGLTNGQRRIADFAVQHRKEIAFMSAREIAAAAQTSDAAVVRFAQALGYDGLGSFRAMLRHELLNVSGPAEIARASAGVQLDPSLIERVVEFDRELVASTIAANRWKAYEGMAADLVSARQIHVVAHGTTYPMAPYLAMSLNEMLGNADTLTAGHGDINHRLLPIGKGDVVVGITFPRYNRYTVEIVELARTRGARILALTDEPASPIARSADRLLKIAHGGVTFGWSHAGTMTAINLLVAAIGTLARERATANLTSADVMLSRIGLVQPSSRPLKRQRD